MSKRFILAFYEIDRAYGGPEEGGWWYDCGDLVRPLMVVTGEQRAYELARRANKLLDRLQRRKRGVGSVAYTGGRHVVSVYENTAPARYPEHRPYYE